MKRRVNNKGFTLIELLAVITIMGILMIVAIPAVTRTIENSRKDTYIDIVKQYVNGAKNMWTSDNLKCGNFVSSAVATGTYYIEVNSASDSVPQLLESGGKSSWGSRDMKGYILVHVYDVSAPGEDGIINGDTNGDGYILGPETGSVSTDDIITRKVDFYPVMSDGIHGVNANASGRYLTPGDGGLKLGEELVRGDIVMADVTYDIVGYDPTGVTLTAPDGFVIDTLDKNHNGYITDYYTEGQTTTRCVEV